jgi:multidrug efflux system membrane fusion protein
MYIRSLLLLIVCASLVALWGCQGEQGQQAGSEDPAIPVAQPVVRKVTDYEDFTGQTGAKEVADIRARVTGHLTKMPFKEGAEVKEGDLLFEIDPRPYKAQYDQAVSQTTLNEASLKLAKANYARDQAAASGVASAVSQQQLDQDKAAVEEAEARLNAARASVEVYKLNLEYTRVLSPIDGQVSRYYLTKGNIINQDSTLLTTVVSLDPMYASFDMDEPTFIRIRQAVRSGRVSLPEEGKMKVLLALPGEEGFPHEGRLNFVNNQFNATTGSVTMRGEFENPKLSGGTGEGKGSRLLMPGMFVRIRLPIGEPYEARLIRDRAIQSDQGRKFVYVVEPDADGKTGTVQYRKVKTLALQEDGLRVVEGVGPKEWVVVGGLQQVKPNMKIRLDPTPMLQPATQQSGNDKVTR